MRLLSVGSCPVASIGIRAGIPMPSSYWLSATDPVVHAFRDYLYYAGEEPVEDVIADEKSPDDERPSVLDICVNKVETLPYNGVQDAASYGSVLEGFRMFEQFLGFRPVSTFSTGREHGGCHSYLSGDCRAYALSTWIIPDEFQESALTFWGQVYTPKNRVHMDTPLSSVRKDGILPNRYTLNGTNTYGVVPIGFKPLCAYLSHVAGAGAVYSAMVNDCYPYGVGLVGFYHVTDVTGFSVTFDSDLGCTVEYRISSRLSQSSLDVYLNPMYRWSFSNKITFALTRAPVGERSPLLVGESRYIQRPSLLSLRTSFQSVCLEADGWNAPFAPRPRYLTPSPYNNWAVPTSNSVVSSEDTYDDLWFTSYPSTGDQLAATRMARTIEAADPEGRFRRNVELVIDDIRVSSYLSSSDSLEKITSNVDNNLVEAISELPEFLDVIPDVKGLITLLKTVAKGPRISTIGQLLKWLASEDLRLVFGTLPNVELLLSTLPRILQVMKRLRSLEHDPVVGYGSFTYDFPEGTFGRRTSRLVTRTKAVFSSYPSGFLADCLGLDALGLLPSPSSLWDLIPLSFVVDWALNVSDRLKDMERCALIGAMDLKVMVHSYTVTSPVNGDIAAFGVTEESLPALTYRWYSREVSRYVPPPRSGRFDFRLPSHLPNWMTAGSLFTVKTL